MDVDGENAAREQDVGEYDPAVHDPNSAKRQQTVDRPDGYEDIEMQDPDHKDNKFNKGLNDKDGGMGGTSPTVKERKSEDPDYTGTLDTMDDYDSKGDHDLTIVDGNVVDRKKQAEAERKREEDRKKEKVMTKDGKMVTR